MRTKRAKSVVETIKFRPGKRLGNLIEHFAKVWKTSSGEAAKRLAALALSELDYLDYPLVNDLASCLEGKDAFEEACFKVNDLMEECEASRVSTQIRKVHQEIERLRRMHGSSRDH